MTMNLVIFPVRSMVKNFYHGHCHPIVCSMVNGKWPFCDEKFCGKILGYGTILTMDNLYF